MFKELGSRFKKGTINLSLTMNEGIMSVMVTFKDLPTDILPRVMRGTPEEIEGNFITNLEEPLASISAFNVKMAELDSVLKEQLKKKEKEVAVNTKKDTPAKKDTKSNQIAMDTSIKKDQPKKEESKKEETKTDNDLVPDLEIEEFDLDSNDSKEEAVSIATIRMSKEHKEAVVKTAVDSNPFDWHESGVKEIMKIKSVDEASATAYYDSNLKAEVEELVKDKGFKDQEDPHKANVEQMKKDANTAPKEEEELDNIFDEEDEFTL